MKWPIDLPQNLLLDGFTNSFGTTAVQTSMSAGPSFSRPRYTAPEEPVTGNIYLQSYEQYAKLRQFYRDDLAEGTLPFDWIHPITQNVVTVRFDTDSPPSAVPLGADQYKATLTIKVINEILPVTIIDDGVLK